jgi:hypothetical protein
MSRRVVLVAGWILVAAGCGHGTAPGEHAAAAATVAADGPTAPPGLRPLTSVLLREPRGDARCPPAFPRFFERDSSAPDADEAALRGVVWLEPGHESDVPPVTDTGEEASAARCFAAGPHRGLNLSNWCCRADPEAIDVPPPDDGVGLVATLSVERANVVAGRDLRLTVAIENRGPEPVDLNLFTSGVNVLFLQVLDAAGNPVATVPPVTPPTTMELLTLPPGGGRTVRHDLAMFDPPLPPGDYAVRVSDPSIASGVLRFRILPAGNGGASAPAGPGFPGSERAAR